MIRTARECLEPGAAVVVDTETTGLHGGSVIVEIAVVDAGTGAVPLDTLVHPDGVEMDPGAQAVHSVDAEALDRAPRWADVVSQSLDVVVRQWKRRDVVSRRRAGAGACRGRGRSG